MIDQSKQDQAIMGVSQNSLEKFKFLIDELGQVAIRTDGNLSMKGLSKKGKIIAIQLNANTWTKLTTGLTSVNTIAIQNKSGISIALAFEDEALGLFASKTVEEIEFKAVLSGNLGNSIALVFDGIKTASVVVNEWDAANPTNLVAMSGDDKVLAPQTVTLSGGVDKKVYADQWVIENDEGIEIDIRNDTVNLYGIAQAGTPTIKLMEIS